MLGFIRFLLREKTAEVLFYTFLVFMSKPVRSDVCRVCLSNCSVNGVRGLVVFLMDSRVASGISVVFSSLLFFFFR